MPESLFDAIMNTVGVPTLLAQFGVPVTHTNGDGDEATIQAILESALVAVGEYGERMEPQTTVTVAKSAGAAVGHTFSHAGEVTDDDPYPDDVVWTAAQAMSDDGYLVQFAVRKTS